MIKKIILLAFFILIPTITAHAYTNQYFDINLPKDYKNIVEKDGVYQWANKDADANYVVSVRLKANDHDILHYSSEEMQKYVTGVIGALEKQYDETYKKDVNVSLIYYGKMDIGNHDALLIEVKIPNFLDLGQDMRQHLYIVESKYFLYSISHASAEKTFNEKELNDTLRSFKFNDAKSEPWYVVFFKRTLFVLSCVTIGVVLGLYTARVIIKKRGIKHEKACKL